MRSLEQFQASFAQALRAGSQAAAAAGESADMAALRRQPGFAVYRNTAWRGCIDALQAGYPTVARLVGDDWFRAAAAAFVRDHWPAAPMLIDYGARFADFLADFAPAAELPYLPAVAMLDRCCTEAHLAADAPVLDAAAFAARLQRDPAAMLPLPVHPATRWCWFEAQPAGEIWLRHRAEVFDAAPLATCSGGVLLTRPHGAVRWQPLSRAGAALLSACAAGASLLSACEAADAAGAGDDLGALLPALIAAGAFRMPPPAPATIDPAGALSRAPADPPTRTGAFQ